MIDAEFNGLFKQLMRNNRCKVVNSLLAGNDTGLFTTEQYARRWADTSGIAGDFILKTMGWPAGDDTTETLAHWHLRTYSRLVEVKPDVWAEASDEIRRMPLSEERIREIVDYATGRKRP